MSKLILHGPALYTNDKAQSFLESGAVLIENDVIGQLGDLGQLRQQNPDATVENLGAGLLMPGLVNLHHHLYSSLARGWNPGGVAPTNFLETLERIWWRLDEGLQLDDIYYSAMVGLCESVRMGVTTVIDHHSSQKTITGSLGRVADAFTAVGVRGGICFELSDRAGKSAFDAALAETVNALQLWPPNDIGASVTAMVGLHASMTLSDDSLRAIGNATHEYSPGYHFHLAEDQIDNELSCAKFGARPVARLAKFDLVNSRSLAVHGVHLESDEVKLLAARKVNLALCPRSNQNNAVGTARWWEYDGISRGLGTDGIGSDMLQEAKAAIYIARAESGRPDWGYNEVGEMLLNNNPSVAEKICGARIGKIAPGYKADLVLWRYNPPTPMNGDNILGHLLYGISNLAADSVWVNGQRILKDGRLNFDYDALLTEARAAAQALWGRI